ncbi:MAG: hypothetical protein MZU97_07570 [Bacillus subtilis]|nr:hypothetical protein [Bacillus subtilis]
MRYGGAGTHFHAGADGYTRSYRHRDRDTDPDKHAAPVSHTQANKNAQPCGDREG